MTYRSKTPKGCSVCGKPAIARRLCRNHYTQAHKAGRLSAHALMGPNDVFWERVDKTPSCWDWTATKNSFGYGIFLLPGERPVRAHRYAYAQLVGKIPDGKIVLHSCDNPACVNPSHLSIGTRLDNNRDASRKGRRPHGKKHWNSRLTVEQVRAIRADHRPQTEIAADYGIGQDHVCRIKQRLVWRSA